MAVAAIVAMLHDVVIAAGIYSVFGFEVTPPTVIAFLTILGYSLYDTIVVFDRVKENERRIAAAGLGGRRPRQRLDEPGADALAEHVGLGVAAGDVAARRRRRPARPGDAAGVRPRPAHRHAHRAPTRRSSSPRRCSACSSGPARQRQRPPRRRGPAHASSCAVSASWPRTGGAGGAAGHDRAGGDADDVHRAGAGQAGHRGEPRGSSSVAPPPAQEEAPLTSPAARRRPIPPPDPTSGVAGCGSETDAPRVGAGPRTPDGAAPRAVGRPPVS